MAKMVVRCRKCWKDVAIQSDKQPIEPCPLCGKPETYFHAMIPGGGGKKEKRDGAAPPG